MIKGLRLKNGMCIVADVIEETDTDYIVEQPNMMTLEKAEGQRGFMIEFFPFNPFTNEKKQEIPKDDVSKPFELKPEIHNKYSVMFGSGLTLPTSDVDTRSLLRG